MSMINTAIALIAIAIFWLGFAIGKTQFVIPDNLGELAAFVLVITRGNGRRDD